MTSIFLLTNVYLFDEPLSGYKAQKYVNYQGFTCLHTDIQ